MHLHGSPEVPHPWVYHQIGPFPFHLRLLLQHVQNKDKLFKPCYIYLHYTKLRRLGLTNRIGQSDSNLDSDIVIQIYLFICLLSSIYHLFTVNVRIPDVRFGEPDINVSGYRIVRISDVRFTTNRPDFECPNWLRTFENRTF